VSARGEQLGPVRRAGEQFPRGYQPRPGGLSAAGQHRGDGEEQLIQQAVAGELAEQPRAALGQHHARAPGADRREHAGGGQRRPVTQAEDRARGGQAAAQPAGSGSGAEDECAGAQRGMPGGYVPARGDDGEQWVRGTAEGAAERGVARPAAGP
jgi:hypothetical protein